NADVVLAGGVEHMGHVPMGKGADPNQKLFDRFPPAMMFMGQTAEILAERKRITREDSDRFALRSNQRAVAAHEQGRFRDELVPVPLPGGGTADRDQGPRADTSLEKLAALQPSFQEGGQVTAGNSSQISDGAAAVLLMSRERARDLGLQPLATVRATAVAGVDPEIMGWGPVPASQKALRRAGPPWRRARPPARRPTGRTRHPARRRGGRPSRRRGGPRNRTLADQDRGLTARI